MRLDHLLSKELDTVGCENGWINPTKTEEVENRRCVLLFSYQAETFLVPMRLGDTPVPIPNTTVKTQSADGTALETVWESRWAPDQKRKTEFNLPVMRDFEWNRKKHLRFLMTDKTSVNMYLENCIHEIWLKVNQISLIQNVKGLYESIIQTQDRKRHRY